jgi:hypothetical protein
MIKHYNPEEGAVVALFKKDGKPTMSRFRAFPPPLLSYEPLKEDLPAIEIDQHFLDLLSGKRGK